MNSIITVLIAYNQFLISQIHKLLIFIAKNIPLNPDKYDITSPKYNKFTVDKLPVIKILEKLDFKQILIEYQSTNGKALKQVNSRGKNPVPSDVVCPRCGAPHQYLYDNSGGRGQFLCKACSFRSINKNPLIHIWLAPSVVMPFYSKENANNSMFIFAVMITVTSTNTLLILSPQKIPRSISFILNVLNCVIITVNSLQTFLKST